MRYYSSTAVVMALTATVNETVTTITVDTVLGLPAQTPFTLVLDVGLSTEEIVTVTEVSGTSLTVTRGGDSSTAVAHTIGAIVRHMMTARDLRDPATHVDATANVHGIGATASVVGTDTAQTLTNKTVNFANNTVVGVPQSAVANLVADLADLVTGLAGKAPTSHTHVASDITNFSAAIDALSPWAAYSPVASSSGGAINLGTTGSAVGKARQDGTTVRGWYVVTFGGTGITVPAGNVWVSLPATAHGDLTGAGMTFVGTAFLYDTSTTTELVRGIRSNGIFGQGSSLVTHVAPVPWATGDTIRGTFEYEVA